MYCGKCGSQIKEGAKFCVKCGASVSNVTKSSTKKIAAEGKNNKLIVIIMLIAMLAVMLLVMGVLFKPETDLDKMVGTWKVIHDDSKVKIYEPDEKGGNIGEMEIIEDEITYGTYEWRKSSNRIIFTKTDVWGDKTIISYNYELTGDKEMVWTDPMEDIYMLEKIE